MQALRKQLAAEAAVQKKLEAKRAADSAKCTVAQFKPLSKTPIESGLSLAWQIILPRLLDHFSNVRLS